MTKVKYLLAATLLALLSSTAQAEAGDWLVKVGGHWIDPKSDNNDIVEVEDATMVTFSASYFLNPNWAIELLAALPFTHDIDLDGGPNIAETKHLPPTLSAQYHFAPNASVRPYVGLGVNYTIFFEEDTNRVLDTALGGRTSLDLDIETDGKVRVAGVGEVDIGTVEIDPWAVGLNIGFRF